MAESELISPHRPSSVRMQVVGISVAMAFILYLDRVCISEIVASDSFIADFHPTPEDKGRILGTFFFTYALFQIPAGWLSDRFGARKMLSIYIVLWSVMTALTGMASSIAVIIFARLACGIAQAGAYPASGAVIRRWFPLHQRTKASSWVALGGRLGAMLAPVLTTVLALQVGGWRSVLMLYFIVGIGIAIGYWFIVRNAPSEHPRVSEAEREIIGTPPESRKLTAADIVPMLEACCRSRALWMCSLAQFSVNIGWAFLATWLNTFIKSSGEVSAKVGSILASSILAMAMLGQLIGGVLGDFSVKKFGLRWGRVLPMAIPSMIAAVAYMLCPAFDSVWPLVICCGIVSLMNDIANPSIWGFVQDVGGSNTAAVYGWMNMWGNFGASASSFMVPLLHKLGEDTGYGQLFVFLALGSGYIVAAIAMLCIDATKPINQST